jgi:hypothetical protein
LLKNASVHFLGFFYALELKEFGEKRKIFLRGNVAPLVGEEPRAAVERIAPGTTGDTGLTCRLLPMMGHRENHVPKIKNNNSLEVQVTEDTESGIDDGARPALEFEQGKHGTEDPGPRCPMPHNLSTECIC